MRRLVEHAYLNDTLIDYLLVKCCNRRGSKKIFAFNSFLYAQFVSLEDGYTSEYGYITDSFDYARVEKTTNPKRGVKVDIFSIEFLAFPICVQTSHWSLAMIVNARSFLVSEQQYNL